MNRRQQTLFLEKNKLLADLEDFKLFAEVKLNLSHETVKHYVRRVRAFIKNKSIVTDKDIQHYIQEKKAVCKPDYVSNIISAFKAYFREYKKLSFMDGYKHPSRPLKIKEEIEPKDVKKFIEAIDDIGVKCFALFLASSGLRKGEVWSLENDDVDRKLRCIIPKCHSGGTKHSGIAFYNVEAENCLLEFEKSANIWQRKSKKLISIGKDKLYYSWKRAKEKSGVYLRPKDMRDFFSQELGKAFVPDRYIDIFQGRAPRNILAKHYTSQGIHMLKEIYEKANLKVLERV